MEPSLHPMKSVYEPIFKEEKLKFSVTKKCGQGLLAQWTGTPRLKAKSAQLLKPGQQASLDVDASCRDLDPL